MTIQFTPTLCRGCKAPLSGPSGRKPFLMRCGLFRTLTRPFCALCAIQMPIKHMNQQDIATAFRAMHHLESLQSSLLEKEYYLVLLTKPHQNPHLH